MLKNLESRLKHSEGFTLVELIVVIGIMIVLISLLVPNVMGYITKAQRTANIATAKTIADTVTVLRVNHKARTGRFPTKYQLVNLLNGNDAGPSGATSALGTAGPDKLVTIPEDTAVGLTFKYGDIQDGELLYIVLHKDRWNSWRGDDKMGEDRVCFSVVDGKEIGFNERDENRGSKNSIIYTGGVWRMNG